MNNQNIFTLKQIEDSFIELQSFILETQKKNVPFFIGRLSGVETNLCGIIINQLKVPDVIISQLLFNAGIKIKSSEEIFDASEKERRKTNVPKINFFARLSYTNDFGLFDLLDRYERTFG
jgi:hypothetical protein